jgi:hypothetical protein
LAVNGFPDDVGKFIFSYIDSVEQLEVLLLLRACREQSFTAKNVSDAMRTSLDSASNRLTTLQRQGFLSSDPATEMFKYSPAATELDTLVGRLEEVYRVRKHKVLELIFSPMKKVARNFADAFVVSKTRGSGEEE